MGEIVQFNFIHVPDFKTVRVPAVRYPLFQQDKPKGGIKVICAGDLKATLQSNFSCIHI